MIKSANFAVEKFHQMCDLAGIKFNAPKDSRMPVKLSQPITAPRGTQAPPEAPQRAGSPSTGIVVDAAWYALQAFAIAAGAVISTLAAINAILHWAV